VTLGRLGANVEMLA
jgi:ribokinase